MGMRAALILICLCAVRQSSRFVIIQAPQCLRSRDAAGATAARDCETVRRGASRCELARSGRWFEAATLAGKPATLAWRRRHRELSAPYSSSRQCIRPASGALPMQCTSVRLLTGTVQTVPGMERWQPALQGSMDIPAPPVMWCGWRSIAAAVYRNLHV